MNSQLEKDQIADENISLANQSGQTFLEFVFVFIVMISMSLLFIRGINGMVGKRWEVMIKIIAGPSQGEVTLQ